MDAARNHLDVDIARAGNTASMLTYLADAVTNGPKHRPGETHKEEAADALLHGAELARDRQRNLLHVASIYDGKVAEPVPPLNDEARAVAEDACGTD